MIKPEELKKGILKVFGQLRGEFPEFKVCCPIPKPKCGDKRFRLGINIMNRKAHCFNCGQVWTGNTLLELLQVKASTVREPTSFDSLEEAIGGIGQTNVEVVEDLFDAQPIEIPGIRLDLNHTLRPEYVEVFELATEYLQEKRGLDAMYLYQNYGFMLPDPGSRYENRLIMPTYEKGKPVYFQARTLLGQEPKYLNPKKTEVKTGKSQIVYNLDQAGEYDNILVCEGMFSAISAGKNAVAIFGCELSEVQAFKILDRKPRRVTLVFDPGTKKSGLKAAKKLYSRADVRIAELVEGDPAELCREDLQYAIKHAEPFNEIAAEFEI